MEEIKYTEEYIQQRLSNFIGSNCRYKIGNIYLFGGESDFMVQKQSSQYIYEYEIKISRSDFLADFKKIDRHRILQDVTKTWKANRFYYVVPDGLISSNEVPKYTGLIYITDNNVLTVKQAPLLHQTKNKIEAILFERIYHRWKSQIFENQRLKREMDSLFRYIDELKNGTKLF